MGSGSDQIWEKSQFLVSNLFLVLEAFLQRKVYINTSVEKRSKRNGYGWQWVEAQLAQHREGLHKPWVWLDRFIYNSVT